MTIITIIIIIIIIIMIIIIVIKILIKISYEEIKSIYEQFYKNSMSRQDLERTFNPFWK